MLSRHGSKYPSNEILKNINKTLVKRIQQILIQIYGNLENGESLKYSEDLKHNQRIIIQNLILWENPMRKGSHKNLNEDGKQFMIELGARMKAKLMPLAKKLTANEVEVTVLLYIIS